MNINPNILLNIYIYIYIYNYFEALTQARYTAVNKNPIETLVIPSRAFKKN